MEQTGTTRTCCLAQHQLQAMSLMLREADHRIANSLQAVIALSHSAAPGDDEISRRIRDHLSTSVSAIATVHRMLSVAQQTGMIPFDLYLEELVTGLGILWSDGTGRRAISSLCQQRSVRAEIAVRLGMIVNELVTNSCKYAYEGCDHGEVRVSFSVNDGTFVLLVADDGRGFDVSAATVGKGRRIVAGISSQLGSRFRYQPACHGTIAILTGPADVLLARNAVKGVLHA
ncbi:sensor histidine kinase [Sphingomonas sp. AR_OL41]|uniref:sensor histidine kinase n=1 Tax=Sphingomonas sp. AR_OL41 TaxID=3042729 RepID=UPI0024817B80|nr:sensor histidine kinase [Sphingomonas sp. AR_OL41]MDH7972864.1 sensor histidine kinase [Sphingomonas sp. AR_OL41]